MLMFDGVLPNGSAATGSADVFIGHPYSVERLFVERVMARRDLECAWHSSGANRR